MSNRATNKSPNVDRLLEYFWKSTTGKIGTVVLGALFSAVVIALSSITWTQISLRIAFVVFSLLLFVVWNKGIRSRLLLLFRATMLATAGRLVKEDPLGFQRMVLTSAQETHVRSGERLDRDERSKNDLRRKVEANDEEIRRLIEEVKTEHAGGNIEAARSLAIRVSYKKGTNSRLKKILAEQEARLRKARERYVAIGCVIEQKETAYEMARLRLQETDGAIEDVFTSQAELAELSRIADEEIDMRIDTSAAQLDAATESYELESRFADLSADAALADILEDTEASSKTRICQSDSHAADPLLADDENGEHSSFLRR